MSIQAIIDRASAMEIDRRRVAGIQFTRNESPRISETPTKNPWKFTLDMPSSLQYSQARGILEQLDVLDRTTAETVNFNSSGLAWMFAYQGLMTAGQIAAVDVLSFVGKTLILENLPNISSAAVLFQPGDFIQIGANPYPFTSTTQVLRGSGSTVTVTTHRPNIISTSVVGAGITVGSQVNFRVICQNMPTYKLKPGGAIVRNGQIVNNALVEFTESFQLYEQVGLS